MHNLSLVDKYRPRRLSEVRGQDWIIKVLSAFTAEPYPAAFLFSGGTGTGKTSTALALAADLGVAVESAEFGGLFQIPSGEQTGDAVRKLIRQLHAKPFLGSGWNVLIVNEADFMTPNAAQVWLDVLERMPPSTVVIFTTNDAGKLPRRFRTRCEHLHFESSALLLTPALQDFINEIWNAETGQTNAPQVSELADVIDESGNLSFRQALQSLGQFVRAGGAPAKPQPKAVKPQTAKKSAPDFDDINTLRSLADRWKQGEKLADLAKLIGVSWQQLIGLFWSNNIVERGCKARA